MVYVCLFVLVLLVLVYAHGPSERALSDPVWTIAIISGFFVMSPLATLKMLCINRVGISCKCQPAAIGDQPQLLSMTAS